MSRIVSALEAADVPCWVAPRDIPGGDDWNDAIMSGITGASALLLVYSRHAVASDPVKREVERALNRRVAIIPVRLEECPPSPGLEYMISNAQWVDAHPAPVDRHLDRVVAAVKRALGRDATVPRPNRDALPQYVGPYRVLGKLGEGGMGTVYKAEQRSPIKRTVALKLVKLGMDSREVVARFESERQALARMDHPNVAKVLDAGTDDSGRPYFVMEYVPGVPITQFADAERYTARQRLSLFAQACEAIAHAHTKALIHRDVKAGNVLAHLADGKPVVKVIDFGIAKALTGDRLTDRTFDTEQGRAIGTYEAMSPEQADGSPDVDTRTDVYSLGLLLYELLAGTKPFDRETLARAADAEARRIIREVAPPRPSTRLSSLGPAAAAAAAARRAPLDVLVRELQSELEWIPLKAIRKERDRRYPSVRALADDVDNFLAGRPLTAGPESTGYRARKFLARHRGPVLATAAVAAVLVLGLVGTAAGLVRARQATEAARVSESRAKASASEATDGRRAAEASGRRAVTAQAEAERQAHLARKAAAVAEARYLVQQADLPAAIDRVGDAARAVAAAGGSLAVEDRLVLDEAYRAAREHWSLVRRVSLPGRPRGGCFVRGPAGGPMLVGLVGRRLAAVRADAAPGPGDAGPGPAPAIDLVDLDAAASGLVATAGGVVVAYGGRAVRSFSSGPLRPVARRDFDADVVRAVASPVSVATLHRDGTIRLLDAATLADRATWRAADLPAPVDLTERTSFALSPDDRYLVLHSGPWTQASVVIDVPARQAVARAMQNRAHGF